MTLLSADQALIKVTESLKILPLEKVSLAKAKNRVLAEDIFAKLTQPPFDASAMDGYAVRAEDLAKIPVTLQQIGEAAAGHYYAGKVQPGQTVRIFTGAPMPEGADTVIIQENTNCNGDMVTITEGNSVGANIRKAGFDFTQGENLLKSGKILNAKDIALAAAMNCHELPVTRRPVVAILATGDELVEPGQSPRNDQIVSSIPYGLAPMIEDWGGEVRLLGIAGDTVEEIKDKVTKGIGADILVTIGGASVGDHDLVQKVLRESGMTLDFWKVAIRPGKPLMYGKLKETFVLGLPGNPISSFICARLFLKKMLNTMLGIESQEELVQARLTADIPENGFRQHYMRANAKMGNGGFEVTPAPSQDSSLLKIYASSNCLIVRSPHADAAKAEELVDILFI